MKLCVVGLGYIGLPTACLFAKAGVDVTGIDIDSKKVEKVQGGVAPFEEPGFAELLPNVVKAKKLVASVDASKCSEADVIIISVPTPVKNRKMDAVPLQNAVSSIACFIKKGALLVIESTISPNTTSVMVRELIEKKSGLKAGKDFMLAHCPERAFPGKTLYEIVNNDRVIGGIDEKSTKTAVEFYSKIVTGGKIYPTTATTAEIVKLSENTFRDVNIGFANELALLCEQFGVNVFDVIELANKHPRVNIHQPGPGVGGHCIPIDPWFLTEQFPAKLIPISRNINDSMPNHVVSLLEKHNIPEKAKIAILGIAYKPNVDDIRESPALEIIHLLKAKEFNVSVFDPHVKQTQTKIEMFQDYKTACRDASAIMLLTKHSIFQEIDWNEVKKAMKNPLIIDCVHLLHKTPKGFTLIGIGRGDLK